VSADGTESSEHQQVFEPWIQLMMMMKMMMMISDASFNACSQKLLKPLHRRMYSSISLSAQ